MKLRLARLACLAACLFGAPATPVDAAPTDFPRFDVEQSCTAFVGTADPKAPMRNLCIQREQRAYDAGGALWANSLEADRTRCLALAERSRSYKYVYLATCLKGGVRRRELSTPQKFRY